MSQQNLSSFIWSVADLLRGDYKQSEYGRVILPFTVLRRLDCVLEPTKKAVLAEQKKREAAALQRWGWFLQCEYSLVIKLMSNGEMSYAKNMYENICKFELQSKK